MLIHLIWVAGSLAVLIWAANRVVIGACAIAEHLGVSPLIIGLTIVAMGTSAPEIMVSVFAVLEGNSGLLLGNVLGSNIANIGLILGISLLFKPVVIPSIILQRDLPLLCIVMIITTTLMLNQSFDWREGLLLILLLVSLIVGLIYHHKKQVMPPKEKSKFLPTLSLKAASLWLIVGLILLPISSEQLVSHAAAIARAFGVSDLFIGLTLIAVGTSLPEFAASLVSMYKKQAGLAIGNIVGSNIFNLLAVLGIPALIASYPIPSIVLWRDIPSMFLITMVFWVFARYSGDHRLDKTAGGVLLLLYVGYLLLAWLTQ